MMDRGNLRNWITKKEQIPKLSSWEVTQQNWWIKWKNKCEMDRKECRTLQNQVKNIQEFGEYSWLQRWMRRHSWERNSQQFKISPWILKISLSPRNWWMTMKKSMVWTNSLGKEFMETTVIDWSWNNYQSSAHKSVCLLRFCVMPREDPSTSRFQRSLEEQNCKGHDRGKLHRSWRYQWRVDWIRVEHLPRIHNVASPW